MGIRSRYSPLLLKLAVHAGARGFRFETVRRWALARGDRLIYDFYCNRNLDNLPLAVQEMRHRVVMNLLISLARAGGDGRLSRHAVRGILEVLVREQMLSARENIVSFKQENGFEPPSFLAISPTQRCNLCCAGCYAAGTTGNAATLEYGILQRILREVCDDWGSHFAVISGGEPFLYRSEGRNLLAVLREFSKVYFQVYSNGTMIDDEVARELAALGNVTVAISVEGFERETDERRGSGVFRKIERAMGALRQAGVPFGISMTATRHNADVLLSEDIISHYFEERGALYAWLFHYVPIGRDPSPELMVTPEQRKRLLERQLDLLWNRKLFFIDFWNGGPLSGGCIAAGREGGYFHVDWNGDVSPCVFIPYAIDNSYEVYHQGRKLSSVLRHPTFVAIRDWQTQYQGNHGAARTGNLFMPCPMCDHHQVARDAVSRFGAKPTHSASASALAEPQYVAQILTRGSRCSELLDPVWEMEMSHVTRTTRPLP